MLQPSSSPVNFSNRSAAVSANATPSFSSVDVDQHDKCVPSNCRQYLINEFY